MKSLLSITFICLFMFSYGQKLKQQRFKNFDKKAFRFGFMLGINSTNFPKGMSEERINATSLDFPLSFIFRTKRFNNFAAYALFGGQYSIDLQSQQDASQNYIDPFIKLNRYDIHGQLGGGIDFYAPFFKFSIEVKYSHGVKSTFIQDYSPVAKPIDQLYNKGWWFSIIFQS